MAERKDNPAPGNLTAPRWDELARKILDLWQDQISAASADPELAAQAIKLMTALPQQFPGAHGAAQFLWPQMTWPQMGPMGVPTASPQMPWPQMPWPAMPGAAGSWPGGWPAGWPQTSPQTQASQGGPSGAPSGINATGPATLAAAPGAGPDDLGKLRARLAELEGRLASVERGATIESGAAVAAGRSKKPNTAGKRQQSGKAAGGARPKSRKRR